MKAARYLAFVILVSSLIHLPVVNAEDAKMAAPILVHQPIPMGKLPPPGAAIKLKVQVQNVHGPQLKARAFVVRDGRLLDVALTTLELDDAENVTYSADVNAPLVDISYQFIVYNNNGPVAASPRYSARRECLPKIDLINIETPTSPSLQEKVEALIRQSKSLEVELNTFERVLQQLDQLTALTKG